MRAILLALLALAIAPAAAVAAELDVRGTWEAGACTSGTLAECEAHPEYPQKFVIETEDFKTGALAGVGETVEGKKESTFTGSINGCTVKTHSIQGTYESEATYTLSADGRRLQGTFNDTFGRKEQPTYGFRASGPGCGSPPTEGEEGAGKRPTGTSVVCNYEFATMQDTCVASVGDGGSGTPSTPTGAVKFTTTSGGFASGATCTLTATPLSPSVASCQLVYFTAYSGLPAITASYSGDSTHAPSSGRTTFLGAAPGEGSLEATGGPAGEYPSEVSLETEVPAPGTTVEVTTQPHVPNPVPVPVDLPAPPKVKDASFATDEQIVEALVAEADVQGGESARTAEKLDKALETMGQTLNADLGTSTEAERQKQIKAMAEVTESITRMEKLRAEYIKDAIEGTRSAGAVEKAIERDASKAVPLLEGSSATGQAKGAKLETEAVQTLEALTKALKAKQEVLKVVIGNTSRVSKPRLHLGRIKIARARPLAHASLHAAAAGKAKVTMKLNGKAVKKLAGHRSSITAVVRIEQILPSKLLPKGLPRIAVKRLVLKRAPHR